MAQLAWGNNSNHDDVTWRADYEGGGIALFLMSD